MTKHESLNDLISNKAAEFADQIKAAAAMADKEEEIRIESEKQLAFIQKDAGIKLEGRHELTVASGREDSVYSRVIIEYKNPKSADSPGSKKVVAQIKKRAVGRPHRQPRPAQKAIPATFPQERPPRPMTRTARNAASMKANSAAKFCRTSLALTSTRSRSWLHAPTTSLLSATSSAARIRSRSQFTCAIRL